MMLLLICVMLTWLITSFPPKNKCHHCLNKGCAITNLAAALNTEPDLPRVELKPQNVDAEVSCHP